MDLPDMMTNLDTKLDRAFTRLAAGDTAQAETLGHEILAERPGHAQALCLLARIALREHRPQQAEQYARQSVDQDPGCVQCWNEYGTVLATRGKLYEAISAFFQALDLDPDNTFSHTCLGRCYQQTGDYRAAIEHTRKAWELAPDDPEPLWRLSTLHYLAGEYDQTIDVLQEFLRRRPDSPMAHYNLGAVYARLQRYDDAIASYEEAVRLNPGHAEAHKELANALALSGAPRQGLPYVKRAIELKPDFSDAHKLLGRLLSTVGEKEQAEQATRRCLALDPENADAYLLLAEITRRSGVDEDIHAMERLSESPDTAPADRMRLGFALGRAYEDLEEFDRAFNHFATANGILRSSYDYDVDDFRRFIERTVEVFDDALIQRLSNAGPTDRTPVFILGMPRSGTSLVEQILSAHPAVYGAGEQYLIERISQGMGSPGPGGEMVEYPEVLRDLDRADLAGLGRSYLDDIRSLSAESARICDKMPHNFRFTGLIRLMLPGARIIHCVRDPVDTCLSCYKSLFQGHLYAQDLTELGRYYRLYERLMGFWRDTFPGAVYEVSYESLVEDPPQAIRALLEFCELDWDSACLDFHRSDRPVMTLSQQQVRRPIYKSAVGFWKRYARHLQPLLKALEDR